MNINNTILVNTEAGCVKVPGSLIASGCYDLGPASFIINSNLIQKAINEGFINELSFYYLLKFYFPHSRIPKIIHPKQRISKLTGLSINTISKYFDKLGLLRLLQPDRNGWSITTFARPNSKKRIRIALNEDATLYTVRDALHLQVLQKNGKGQSIFDSLEKYIKNKTVNGKRINTVTNEDIALKREPKYIKFRNQLATYIAEKQAKELPGYTDPDTLSYKPFFSVRYVARILNISHVSAYVLLCRFRDKGFIKQYFEGAEFVCRGGDPSYLEDMFDYKYLQNGALYRIEPARYEFIINPIAQKAMTFARYKKLVKNPKVRKFVNELNLKLTA